MTYENIVIFVTVLFVIFGGLITIDKVHEIVERRRKPSVDLQQTVADHEKRLAKVEAKIHDSNKVQNRALLQIMNHMIDGNHVDKLIEARDDLQEYLTDK